MLVRAGIVAFISSVTILSPCVHCVYSGCCTNCCVLTVYAIIHDCCPLYYTVAFPSRIVAAFPILFSLALVAHLQVSSSLRE